MAYTHSWKSIATLVINQTSLPFSHELLERTKDIIRGIYSYLLEQKLSKGRIDDYLKQNYYDNLIRVDKFDENCVGLVGYCDIWRTEHKIPKALGSYYKDAPFNYVGTGVANFTYTSINNILQSYLPYVGGNIKYDYVNGYIYVWDNKKPYTFIKITDIFNDPNDVLALCGGKDGNNLCLSDNVLIPIDETLLPTVIQEAKNNLTSLDLDVEIGTKRNITNEENSQ